MGQVAISDRGNRNGKPILLYDLCRSGGKILLVVTKLLFHLSVIETDVLHLILIKAQIQPGTEHGAQKFIGSRQILLCEGNRHRRDAVVRCAALKHSSHVSDEYSSLPHYPPLAKRYRLPVRHMLR